MKWLTLAFIDRIPFLVIIGCVLLRSVICDHIHRKAETGGQWSQYSNKFEYDDSLSAKLEKSSCPLDAVPFYVNKQPKPCYPDRPRQCPSKAYSCHKDINANVSICCGKVEVCRHGQPQMNTVTNRPVGCHIKNQAEYCQPPYVCQVKHPKSRLGYCCPSAPPPAQKAALSLSATSNNNGCPWGAKITTVNGGKLACNSSQSIACSMNATCRQNNSGSQSKCCGNDQSDGCPDGFRPKRINGDKIPCSVEAKNSLQCSIDGICHWDHLTKAYQCCERDNGCPDGMVPIIESTGAVRQCSDNSQCPQMHCSCHFNPWRGQFQCCKRLNADICPPSEILYTDSKSLEAIQCAATGPTCPAGSVCRKESNEGVIGVCCIPAGQCPRGYVSSTKGDIFNISLTGPAVCDGELRSNQCIAPSLCLRAIDSGHSPHFLCCIPIPQCLHSNQNPYLHDDAPRICSNSSSTTQCPAGYQCQPSTLPSVNVCCSTTGTGSATAQPLPVSAIPNLTRYVQTLSCPLDYELQKGTAVVCDPRIPTSCEGESRCLASSESERFLCCTPMSTMSRATCPSDGVFMWNQAGGPKLCDPNYSSTGCPQTHPLCLFHPPISHHTCCRVPICPNGNEPLWTPGTTIPRRCGPEKMEECPYGYVCLFAPVFEASVCCLSRFRAKHSFDAGYQPLTFNPRGQEQRRPLSVANRWPQFHADVGRVLFGKK